MPNKMNRFNSNKFHRELLPNPGQYFREQGLKLTGGGEWKSALCPFHSDTRPSLRLRLDSGGFKCMVCGVKGGNVLDFHMKLYNKWLNRITLIAGRGPLKALLMR